MSTVTYESALEYWNRLWRITIEADGGHCPVCDRWGKIYARPINKTMALSVLWLAQTQTAQKNAGKGDWVNVPIVAPRWLVRSNQLPTMRWWNMVERQPSEDPKRKHSGLWRCTDTGLRFAFNNAPVPARVLTYNDSVEGYSEEQTTFSACVEDFDYSGVMSPAFSP